MANKFQVKRTTVSGRTPNTTNSGNTHFIDTGELALNLTDGKLFSSNGSVSFEVGANLANLKVTGEANVSTLKVIGDANVAGKLSVTASSGDEGGEIFLAAPANTTLSGGVTIDAYQNKIRFFEQGGTARGAYIDLTACIGGAGTNLLTGGVGGSGTVTQVNTGIGLTGGPITSNGTVDVLANTGIIANATGLYVNSTYIATLDANNSSYLGGVAAASYVQNTDSRTLSGNLVISGTYFNPSSNTVLLGNTTQRWVVSANTGDFSDTVTGTSANMSTSVNSALLTVGTSFIANTTGAYHTGTVNAASFTTTGVTANVTGVYPTSNSSGSALGTTTRRWIIIANTITGTSINIGTSALIANSNDVVISKPTTPSSNTVQLGNSTQRWVLSANTINASGLITGSAGANIQGTANLVDVNISGNLTVSGTTTYVNTTNLNVGDNIVTLNADLTNLTAPTENAGLEVNRGSLANVHFLWNETSDSWTAGNTDITGFANVTSTIQGGSSLSIAGALSGVTTAAMGNTTITGFANASVSVNSALLTVGTSFIANTTGAYHTGTINSASYTIGSNFSANSTVVTTSDQIISTRTGSATDANGQIFLNGGTSNRIDWAVTGIGAPSVSTRSSGTKLVLYPAVAAASVDFGMGIDTNVLWSSVADTGDTFKWYANTTVLFDANTSGITVGSGGIFPTSNSSATSLGSATQRWVLNANTGSFAGAVSGITTLAAGNTTITGFANVTSTIQGGSSLTIAGAASGITTLAAGNTTITGFANATVSVNSALLTVGTSFIANSTAIVGTGFANISTSVNSALLTVGTSFIANTTGAYHTGLVNAASINIGGSGFIANSTAIVLGEPVTANGTTGTAGQVLTSNGTTGSPYWATSSGGVTSIAAGNGLTGGTITTTGTLSVSAQSGLLANSTGLYVNATSIALGTVPTARLGSGTANSTTFLAGDQTYKTIAGGSGTVTSIVAGNGLSGGTITTSGTIAVTAGTGVTSNATGVHIGQAVATGSSVQFGSFGVGTAASGTAGEIRATNNITAYYSDKRLKKDIIPINNPIEKILAISGIYYRSNDVASQYGYKDQSQQVGVLAQEIEQVLPHAVKPAPFDTEFDSDGNMYSKSGENYLTVQYEKLIPLLIEAIKDQQKQINELRAEITKKNSS